MLTATKWLIVLLLVAFVVQALRARSVGLSLKRYGHSETALTYKRRITTSMVWILGIMVGLIVFSVELLRTTPSSISSSVLHTHEAIAFIMFMSLLLAKFYYTGERSPAMHRRTLWVWSVSFFLSAPGGLYLLLYLQ